MQISTYAKAEVETGVLVDRMHPFVLISLRDPGEPLTLPPTPACCGVLTIECLDIDENRPDAACFHAEHAQQIVDAVTSLPQEIKEIVVHCHAGISRSTAVAAALAQLFRLDDTPFVTYPKYPNRHIYRTLYAALSQTYAQRNRDRLVGSTGEQQ